MTAPAQMPIEPPIVRDSRKFAHPESIEFDLLAHIDALRAHAESLQAEVERLRNCYATEVRTAQAYLRRTEQSERKLAEALLDLGLVKTALDQKKALLISCETALSERDVRLAEAEALRKVLHYPECWDTAAYPTLERAAKEVFECNECCYADRSTEERHG